MLPHSTPGNKVVTTAEGAALLEDSCALLEHKESELG